MEEDFLGNELISRFEQMIEDRENYYFDAEDLAEIIAYYLDVGDLPFAYKALEYALKLHPTSEETNIKLLEYYLEVNLLKEAKELIEELKPTCSNHLDFVMCEAKYWSLKEQYRHSIKFYKKALEFKEESDYIHNCLGSEFLMLNEIGQALFHFKSALELNLDDEFAFYSCIQCFNDIHRHKECIDFLTQYIDLKPYSEQAWFQLGLQHISRKEYEKAIQAFDYATLINTKSITAFMQMAFCYEKLDQLDQAIQLYKETLAFDDSAAFTHLKIGLCYKKLEKSFKALKAFHQSIHEDPQLDKAWSEAADIYEKLGNIDEGIHYLKRAIELDSQRISYHKRLAFLYIQNSQFEESVQVYETIVKLEPGNFFNWLGYSELLLMLGDYNQAVKVVKKGLKRFQRAELYYQISCAYYLLNDEEQGEKYLLKAVQLNPKILQDMIKKYPVLQSKNVENRSSKKLKD